MADDFDWRDLPTLEDAPDVEPADEPAPHVEAEHDADVGEDGEA